MRETAKLLIDGGPARGRLKKGREEERGEQEEGETEVKRGGDQLLLFIVTLKSAVGLVGFYGYL